MCRGRGVGMLVFVGDQASETGREEDRENYFQHGALSLRSVRCLCPLLRVVPPAKNYSSAVCERLQDQGPERVMLNST